MPRDCEEMRDSEDVELKIVVFELSIQIDTVLYKADCRKLKSELPKLANR